MGHAQAIRELEPGQKVDLAPGLWVARASLAEVFGTRRGHYWVHHQRPGAAYNLLPDGRWLTLVECISASKRLDRSDEPGWFADADTLLDVLHGALIDLGMV